MRPYIRLLFPVLALVAALPLFGQEGSKTVRLKSGDMLTGEVVSETDSTVTIRTSVGTFTIHQRDIQREKITLTLKQGDVLTGDLLGEGEEGFRVATAFGNVTIPRENIERIDMGSISSDAAAPASAPSTDAQGRWFFSDEKLVDIWFDPTGFVMSRGEFYLSGLSWGFGLTPTVQVTSRWGGYFSGDLNVRPKAVVFRGGTVDREFSFAVGADVHTRRLPSKWVWKEEKKRSMEWHNEGQVLGDPIPGWVRVGSKRIDNADGSFWYDEGGGDKAWGELFAAFSTSSLRSSGHGRIGYTLGAGATLYPDHDAMVRAYGAVDIDVRRNLKVMAELFYDPYYAPFYLQYSDFRQDPPLYFDFGFMTNSLPFFGRRNDRFWFGIHFQQPFIAFYWKF